MVEVLVGFDGPGADAAFVIFMSSDRKGTLTSKGVVF